MTNLILWQNCWLLSCILGRVAARIYRGEEEWKNGITTSLSLITIICQELFKKLSRISLTIDSCWSAVSQVAALCPRCSWCTFHVFMIGPQSRSRQFEIAYAYMHQGVSMHALRKYMVCWSPFLHSVMLAGGGVMAGDGELEKREN